MINLLQEKIIKLSPKRAGRGDITSFTINIGINEARQCGFLNSEDNALEVKKVLDPENNQIIIKLNKK